MHKYDNLVFRGIKARFWNNQTFVHSFIVHYIIVYSCVNIIIRDYNYCRVITLFGGIYMIQHEKYLHVIICALFFILLLIPGCTTKKEESEKAGPVNVFSGESVPFSDSLVPLAEFCPYYDPERSLLKAVCRTDGEDRAYGIASLSVLEDGVELAETTGDAFPLAEGESIVCGSLSADGYICVVKNEDNTCRILSKAVDTVHSADLAGFTDSRFLPRTLSVGPDGSIWMVDNAADDLLVVLESDLTLRFARHMNDMMESVASDGADGAWILSSFYGLRHVDRFGEPEDPIPHESGILNSVFRMPSKDGTSFAPACVTDRGIEVWEEDEWQLFMDYAESGLTPLSSLLTVLPDRSAAVFVKHGLTGDLLFLYRRRETTDPDAAARVRTLEIGILAPTETMMDMFLRNCVTEFNASHDDVKITVVNYCTGYDRNKTALVRDAMVRDIVTGIHRPDMLLLNEWNFDIFEVLLDHQLCLDLTSYIDRDPEVNRETLFGAVFKTMTYDGMIWGLPESIACETLIGLNSVLGEYAGRESWTLEEELDFIASLTPDVEPMQGLMQNEAIGRLLYYTDLRQFIDLKNGTCSFDSPEAVRLFEWISTLPATGTEYRKRFSSRDAMLDDLDVLYAEGKIALNNGGFSGASSYAGIPLAFLKDSMDELTMIGYPTVGESGEYGGIVTTVDRAVMILNTSGYPDDAWTFLCAFLKDPLTAFYASPLRTVFLDEATGPVDPAPKRDGLRVAYGWDERYAVADILDRVGSPLLSGISEDVSAIISEELSAMTAGNSTPEKCAKMIQSRVSIWLAEHQ